MARIAAADRRIARCQNPRMAERRLIMAQQAARLIVPNRLAEQFIGGGQRFLRMNRLLQHVGYVFVRESDFDLVWPGKMA